MSTLKRTLQRLRIDLSRAKEEKRQHAEEEQAERWFKQDDEAKERMMKEAEEDFRLKTGEDSIAEYCRQKDLENVKCRGMWETMLETRKLVNAEPVVMDVEFSNDGFEYADFEAYGMVRYHMFGEDIISNGPDESVRNKIPNNLYGSKYGRHPYIIPDMPGSSTTDAKFSSTVKGDLEFSKLAPPLRQSTPFEDGFSRSPTLTEGCFDETDFEFSSENLLAPASHPATSKSCSNTDTHQLQPAISSSNSENLTEEDRSPRRLSQHHSCLFAACEEEDQFSVYSTCSENSPNSSSGFHHIGHQLGFQQ